MILRKVSKYIAGSSLLKQGKELWSNNQQNWNLPMTRLQKLRSGIYLILMGYAAGSFPPTFTDQQKAFDAEINYLTSIPGVSTDKALNSEMCKPFWYGPLGRYYLGGFIEMLKVFEKLGICPPMRVLELGCGTGWMAEFLALMKFDVIATSIVPGDIERASTRIKSISAKGLDSHLNYIATPMEIIDEAMQNQGLFDVVFAYEALHHAYDWAKTVNATYKCLKPGGWLVLCREPNILHTYVSYRVARLTNTHEIGFKRSDLRRQILSAGFRKVVVLSNYLSLGFRPHWIAGQK